MKLRNKRTGEIGWLYCDHISVPKKMTVFSEDKDLAAPHWDYSSLAELTEDWEDYKEPKDYYFIRSESLTVGYSPISNTRSCKNRKEIGNFFETKEEAEKAVEKLKAWKRLKEAGFIVHSWNGNLGGEYHYDCCGQVNITAEVVDSDKRDTVKADLNLLFGGEE